MSTHLESPHALATLTRSLHTAGRPPVVGISGFGGSGKSTLAAELQDLLEGSVVVSSDDYLLERPPTSRSDDWSVVDRERLAREVLDEEQEAVVLVEGIGLFVPGLLERFDLTVWVDVDLDRATEQGIWRDTHVWNNPQEDLWHGVWKPNDADFFARYRPDLAADLLYRRPPGPTVVQPTHSPGDDED
ncbi:uridine kinase [Nocardioides sp. LS1]|uniref:uridine kinase family protein n=1 Tax=Nocardioides sp. LS1 TaxID=1027620 RepID=UPI000F61EFA9|nr:hypothetical protein [Nocardioides sp. LS1]GCD88962.1 uridine kinase [Nocardioides sp. LS1]